MKSTRGDRVTALYTRALLLALQLKEHSFCDVLMTPLPRVIINLPIGILNGLQVGIGRVSPKVANVSIAPPVCCARGLDERVYLRILPPRADTNQ
jgi:hypothetical protein